MTGRIRAYAVTALLVTGCASVDESPRGAGQGQTVDGSAGDAADAGDATASRSGFGTFVPLVPLGGTSTSAPKDGSVDGTTDSSLTPGGPPDSGPTCGYDAGTAPAGRAKCGDGFRDPATEECDDGLGTSTTVRRGCSAGCQVLDELAVAETVPDSGLPNPPRTLGAGRHPVAASDSSFAIAYLSPSDNPLSLSLATFNPKAVSTGTVTPLSVQSTIVDNSNPVVAGLPCGQYAAAWADFGGDGDELGVALRLVQPGVTPTASPAFANTTTTGSQYDPDILALSSGEVVVAWVDDSDPTTAPDLRWRSFDEHLNPTTGEQSLAATPDSEADVALATFGASDWAAAWRDDSAGLETIRVHAGSTDWTIGPAFLPAPAATKPALTALDGTHLLVAYAVGVDSTDSGVANGSFLQLAVLDTGSPATIVITPLAGTLSTQSQSQPALATVQGQLFLSWWTAAAPGDPLGEENWIKPLTWTNGKLGTGTPEVTLPRWSEARAGDQRSPALVANTLLPGGALIAAWDDLGRGILPAEGAGDVAVDLLPVPILRTGAQTCPQGWTDCNGNPEYGCETNLSQASHCGSCTNACPAGGQCFVSGGTASCITCTASTPLLCGGTCVDPTTNTNDCGGCGNVCPNAGPAQSSAACSGGVCGWQCNGNLSACPSGAPTSCVNLQTDPNNCGTCGTTCAGPPESIPGCNAGTCGFACKMGWTACPSSAPTECANLLTDVSNCGACGTICPMGPSGSSPTCTAGVCGWTCNSGFTQCNGACLPDPDPTQGVFVARGNPVTNCGGMSAPCGSIDAGLQAAGNAGKSVVYIASGMFNEPIVLSSSLTLNGGWTYLGGGSWQPVCSSNPATATTIQGVSMPGMPNAGVVITGGSPTLVNLTVESPSTGLNQYGIFAANAGTVTLTNLIVQAGSAGNGSNGVTGNGGSVAPSTCTAAATEAGAGGAPGSPGSAGSGAMAGTWAATGYVATLGGGGTAGGPGGNGGPGAPGTCTFNLPTHSCKFVGTTSSCVAGAIQPKVCGLAGVNGCGGGGSQPGTPGGGGGSSVAVYAWNTHVSANGTFTAGNGGQGGNGGAGGPAAPGSTGATGMEGTIAGCSSVFPSCIAGQVPVSTSPGGAGTTGGTGGTGGQAGGGSGGNSYCFVGAGGGTVGLNGAASCTHGTPGAGGNAGGGASQGQAGSSGTRLTK